MANAPACTLLVFMDDATGRLMELHFVPSETTFAYFAALEACLAAYGRPVALAIVLGPMADKARYSDKHTVFRVGRRAPKTGHGITQIGRALEELGIEILCADSSQAKGRVERANRTLQDRLVKELRLEAISDMAAGNAFLPGFVERYNHRFAKTPHRPEDLHRSLNVGPDRLRAILCLREHRYVGAQLSFRFEPNRVILDETEVTRGLAGKYVQTLVFPDGGFEVRWNGMVLPYRVFSKDQQRVTQASIVANKNLSAVLEHIKAEQEKAKPKSKREPAQRTRYTPNGRRNDGWNSLAARKKTPSQSSATGSTPHHASAAASRPRRKPSPRKWNGSREGRRTCRNRA
jgi:hypothetical protein